MITLIDWEWLRRSATLSKVDVERKNTDRIWQATAYMCICTRLELDWTCLVAFLVFSSSLTRSFVLCHCSDVLRADHHVFSTRLVACLLLLCGDLLVVDECKYVEHKKAWLLRMETQSGNIENNDVKQIRMKLIGWLRWRRIGYLFNRWQIWKLFKSALILR